MKTIVKKSLLFLIAAVLFQGLVAFAQEEDKTKVHLKVKKNDEVTLDTTLYVKSGAESDELKKLIQKYTDMEGMDLHVFSTDDKHKDQFFKVVTKDADSLHTVYVTTRDKAEDMDVEIIEKDGKQIMIKKKGSSDESKKVTAYAYDKADNIVVTSKNIKVMIDTLETLDEKGEKQVRVTVKTGDEGGENVWVSKGKEDAHHIIMKAGEGGEHVWVSKGKEDAHHIIVKAGEGGEKVFAIVSGDTTDLKALHEKGDFLKVIKEDDYKKIGKDEKGNYYIVKEASDLDEGEEIVIKKKDGKVVIMKGDKILDVEGKNVYIKKYDNKEGSFDIFLEKGDDGTVVVKKNIKVIKKKDEEGEDVIEVIIEEGDKVKAKEGAKKEKVVKEKKSKEIK